MYTYIHNVYITAPTDVGVCSLEQRAARCDEASLPRTHGPFPIGFISNGGRFELGSIPVAFLPNDLPELEMTSG